MSEDKPRIEFPVMRKRYDDGVPCHHRGCLAHMTHPCEGCGRIGGITHPSCEYREMFLEAMQRKC